VTGTGTSAPGDAGGATGSAGLPPALAGHEPSATALIEGERRITYGDLVDRVGRTAGGLRQRGVGRGGRVVVTASNTIDAVVAYLGVQAAGAAAVMLNPRSPRAELAARLQLTHAELVVLGGPDADLPDGLDIVRPCGAPAGDGAGDTPELDGPPPPFEAADDDVATVLFTSGATGSPHPVALSHANLAAVQRAQIRQAGGRLGPSSVALGALPIAHVFGLNGTVATLLRAGGAVVLVDRFSPGATLDLIARQGVDVVSAVPQMWAAWVAGDARGDELSRVVRAVSSATHLPPAVSDAVRERFGVRVAGGYGLTESSGTILLDDLVDPLPTTVGRPLEGVELCLVDLDVVEAGLDPDLGPDLREVEAELGDRGELWVRGPSLFLGYLDDPAATARVSRHGWLRTGDVGVADDDDRITIVDRIKDVVIVSGFNVSPSEVEDVLVDHPSVGAALVVGEADERTGERVVAFVTPSGGAPPEPEALIAHCRSRLARYKVPSRVVVSVELPSTDGGKAVRHLLRD
jgi:long-chain acyl-CoA synthetase